MVNERRRLYGYQPKENFVLAVITLHNFKVAIFSRRSIIATSGRRFSFRVQISTADKALVLLAVIKLAHFYSLLNHDCHRPNGDIENCQATEKRSMKGCASFHISTQRERLGNHGVWGELTGWEWLGGRAPTRN